MYLAFNLGRWQSGQLHQTVNLAAEAYGGSNPSLPTDFISNHVTRDAARENAVVAQLVEHQPSKLRVASSSLVRRSRHVRTCAYVAQSVEHVLGKDEVTGSSPVVGSTELNGNGLRKVG